MDSKEEIEEDAIENQDVLDMGLKMTGYKKELMRAVAHKQTKNIDKDNS